MIRAMSLMAVRAIPAEDQPLPIGIAEIVIVEKDTDMTAAIRFNLCVALLTKLRSLFGQQEAVIRPVGAVAQAAILGGRIMLPEKGTTLFGVTIVAVVVQAQLLEHERAE